MLLLLSRKVFVMFLNFPASKDPRPLQKKSKMKVPLKHLAPLHVWPSRSSLEYRLYIVLATTVEKSRLPHAGANIIVPRIFPKSAWPKRSARVTGIKLKKAPKATPTALPRNDAGCASLLPMLLA